MLIRIRAMAGLLPLMAVLVRNRFKNPTHRKITIRLAQLHRLVPLDRAIASWVQHNATTFNQIPHYEANARCMYPTNSTPWLYIKICQSKPTTCQMAFNNQLLQSLARLYLLLLSKIHLLFSCFRSAYIPVMRTNSWAAGLSFFSIKCFQQYLESRYHLAYMHRQRGIFWTI